MATKSPKGTGKSSNVGYFTKDADGSVSYNPRIDLKKFKINYSNFKFNYTNSPSSFVNWAESLWRAARGGNIQEAFLPGPVEMDEDSLSAVKAAQTALIADDSEVADGIRRLLFFSPWSFPDWKKLSPEAREAALAEMTVNPSELIEIAMHGDLPEGSRLGAAIQQVVSTARDAAGKADDGRAS